MLTYSDNLALQPHLIDLIIDPFDFDLGEERRAVTGGDIKEAVLLHAPPDGANVCS